MVLGDTTQGRLVKVSPKGELIFDQRFGSTQKDTNIECYGIAYTAGKGASAATSSSADASARRSSLALASADASTGGGGGGSSSNDGYILACGTGVEPGSHPFDSVRLRTWMVLVHRTDSEGKALWQRNYSSNRRSVFGTYRNNAGEYIVATREGVMLSTSTPSCGNQVTGGNFALMLPTPVVNGTVRPSLPIDGHQHG